MLKDYQRLLKFSLDLEFARKDKFFSSLLLSLTFLFLLSLARSSQNTPLEDSALGADTFLVLVFALEMMIVRLFEEEAKDGAMEIFRLSRPHPFSWYLAKVHSLFICGGFIFVPSFLFASLLGEYGWPKEMAIGLFLAAMVLHALSLLGSLLGLAFYLIPGKEFLLPIIFFPLCVPLLLSGMGAFSALYHSPFDGEHWLYMLFGINLVFAILGALLFAEFVELSSEDE